MKVNDFQKKKIRNEKITLVTCYDATSAKIVEASEVDAILVGDTAAMTMHGYPTTVPATLDMMVWHTQSVSRVIKRKFIVGDLPFLSYRHSLAKSMQAVQAILQAGAQAIKLEGVEGNQDLIQHIVESGVPVMGHLGLTPQSVHSLGGFRIQGRGELSAETLIKHAQRLQEAGCFAIVLECIPVSLAHRVTESLHIPTIGIGAGPYTSGQILVWQDLLGMQEDLNIKFVKRYLNGFELIKKALNTYHHEVQRAHYPDLEKHCYDEVS